MPHHSLSLRRPRESAHVLFRKEETRRERLVLPSSLVSRFVFPRGALFEQTTDNFYKRALRVGEKPSILSPRCVRFSFSVAAYIGSLSFSVYACISKESARVCSRASRFIGFRFSLCSCRSFPRKRLVSKDRERKERINWRQHHREEERRP